MVSRFKFVKSSLFALMFVLSGCGGGGDNLHSANDNPEGAWLSFSPPVLRQEQYEGESLPIIFTGTSRRTFSAPFNIRIDDGGGLITTQVGLTTLSEFSYKATLWSNPGLNVGLHQSQLQIHLCEDDPSICAVPFPGSPWHVPMSIEVKPWSQDKSPVSLSPSTVKVTTQSGHSVRFSVEARLSQDLIRSNANIGIVDPADIADVPPANWVMVERNRYVFSIATNLKKTAAIGRYSSVLELRVCHDDIRDCRMPVGGSPWLIPLDVTVNAPTNQPPLRAIDGLGAWVGYQGNAGRTGFINANFDPASFSHRWELNPNKPSQRNSPFRSVAMSHGRIYLTDWNWPMPSWDLKAIYEDSGKSEWTISHGVDPHNYGSISPPAVVGGRVYYTTNISTRQAFLVWDQFTADLINRVDLSSLVDYHSAPVVYGDNVYIGSGPAGGVGGYSDTSGRFFWNNRSVFSNGLAPTAGGLYVYAYNETYNRIDVLNASDGSLAFYFNVPFDDIYRRHSPVVLGADKLAFFAGNGLVAFDLKNRKLLWSIDQGEVGAIAYGNLAIYTVSNRRGSLEARDSETGVLLWASPRFWPSGESSLIVTRNLAFVGTASETLAIDLKTHQIVWSYPLGGALAISENGVLTILNGSGQLVAINLT